jgi:hypothetical protein
VASWSVLAGAAQTSLTRVGAARRSGFETAIAVPVRGPYFAVEAHDAKGRALLVSLPVRML